MSPIHQATIDLLRLVQRAQRDEWDVSHYELTEPAMTLIRALENPDLAIPDDILGHIEKFAWAVAIWGIPPNLSGDALAVTTAMNDLIRAVSINK